MCQGDKATSILLGKPSVTVAVITWFNFSSLWSTTYNLDLWSWLRCRQVEQTFQIWGSQIIYSN